MAQPVRILHLHSSFDPDEGARTVRLMNAWGDRARHVVVSGDPNALGPRDLIDRRVLHEVAQDPPPLTGKPSVKRYEAIARLMRRFDLVLTHGWGAIDGVMARRVFAAGAPPVVHHEDGLDEAEVGGLKLERSLYRRVALGAAHALVVPSRGLEGVALKAWKQPSVRVHRIADGLPTALYDKKPDAKAIPGLVRKEREVVIGAVASLTPVKDPTMLVRAAGGLSGRFRLVIVGEGPEREAVIATAHNMGIADRLVMPGPLPGAYRYMGLFDLLALPSRIEGFPVTVVEAMAAGLPVASTPVGDVSEMVAPENHPYIATHIHEVPLRDAIQPLLLDAELRARVGAANRSRAKTEYDEAVMVRRYGELYEAAMGKPGALNG